MGHEGAGTSQSFSTRLFHPEAVGRMPRAEREPVVGAGGAGPWRPYRPATEVLNPPEDPFFLTSDGGTVGWISQGSGGDSEGETRGDRLGQPGEMTGTWWGQAGDLKKMEVPRRAWKAGGRSEAGRCKWGWGIT